MILFGDATRLVDSRACLAAIVRDSVSTTDTHDARVRVFLALAELTTAIADEERSSLAGIERRLRDALLVAARNVDASWRAAAGDCGVRDPIVPLLPEADALPDGPLWIKRPEGYAYYALYPELYAEAARRAVLPENTCVIGLRSIGTGLAAMVAAACGASTFHTLRPHGDPFTRRVTLDAETAAHARDADAVAIVDEGPGLSGSSFLGTLEAVETLGVARERVHLFPSHAHGPGAAAPDAARTTWEKTTRHVVSFENAVLGADGRGRLATAVADITGPLLDPPRDLSGGAWRALFSWRERPPVFLMQERRKLLFTGRRGTFLAKFAGLGDFGTDQADLQARLAEAGFVAPLAGMTHGFIVTRWIEATPLEDFASADERRRFLERLADYLAFRATKCPAEGRPGADVATLAHMARRNISLAIGCDMEEVDIASEKRLRDLGRISHPVRTDGRLHRWEWLRRDDGSFLKSDAIDHHAGHDLIGCQDIAWDVAGAAVEHALDEGELRALRDIIRERTGRTVDEELVALDRLFYAAFQIGLWTYARDGSPTDADRDAAEARIALYRRVALDGAM